MFLVVFGQTPLNFIGVPSSGGPVKDSLSPPEKTPGAKTATCRDPGEPDAESIQVIHRQPVSFGACHQEGL